MNLRKLSVKQFKKVIDPNFLGLITFFYDNKKREDNIISNYKNTDMILIKQKADYHFNHFHNRLIL